MPNAIKKYIKNQEILSTLMDGDVVMMDAESGNYFNLSSGVGATIWELLDQPVSVEDLVAAICNEYNTTKEECTPDVQGFLAQLEENQLILPADNA